MNVIVRTAGVGRGADELKWDLESYLSPLWRAIETAGSQQKAPLLIYREANLLVRAARSHIWGDIDRIVCDTPGSFREISDFLALVNPDMGSRVSYHEGDGDMLSEAIEAQVDRIFEREIGLPSGGKVVFDRTEALVAIDVNSARSRSGADIEETALTTNLEAAQAVALHLRLRDLSGLIVVDFIDMMSADNRAAVEREFRTLLRVDRAQVRSTGISQFGMMELSRQRLDTELDEAHGRACPTCNGAGRVRRSDSFALSLLRSLRAEAVKPKASAIFLRAPLETAVYLLNEKRIELRRLEDLGQCDIFVTPDAEMNPPNYSLRLFADKTAGAEPPRRKKKRRARRKTKIPRASRRDGNRFPPCAQWRRKSPRRAAPRNRRRNRRRRLRRRRYPPKCRRCGATSSSFSAARRRPMTPKNHRAPLPNAVGKNLAKASRAAKKANRRRAIAIARAKTRRARSGNALRPGRARTDEAIRARRRATTTKVSSRSRGDDEGRGRSRGRGAAGVTETPAAKPDASRETNPLRRTRDLPTAKPSASARRETIMLRRARGRLIPLRPLRPLRQTIERPIAKQTRAHAEKRFRFGGREIGRFRPDE